MEIGKRWSEDDLKYLIQNYRYKNNEFLEEYFGRSKDSIKDKAYKLGLKKDRSVTDSKYNVNHLFFSNPNIKNSYLAGYILADGYIKSGTSNITFHLSSIDEEYLKRIKCFVNFTGPILKTNYIGPKDKLFESVWMTIHSNQWIEDLKNNFNIDSTLKRLNRNIGPPKELSYELQLCFLLGLIDGDGCIGFEKIKGKVSQIRLSIVGSYELIDWVADIFKKETKTKTRGHKHSQCDMQLIHIDAIKAMIMLSKLYKIKELSDIRMCRKWDKVKEWDQKKYENKFIGSN